jgi:hypothetical protein
MNRSRGVMLLSLVLAAGLAVAALLFLDRAPEDGGAAGVLRAPAAATGSQELPGAGAGAAARDPVSPEELAAAAGAPPAAGDPAAQEPTRALRGQGVLADGSAIPPGLHVYAALRRPPPRLVSLRDQVNDSVEDDADGAGGRPRGSVTVQVSVGGREPSGAEAALGDAPLDHDHAEGGDGDDDGDDELDDGSGAAAREALKARTLTPVTGDGSFEMLHAPQRSVWLAVEHDQLYADPAVRVAGSESHAELRLVRGAMVSGRVTDAAGAGVPQASVDLGTSFDPFMVFDSSSRMASVGARADAEGRYVARQVPAGLQYVGMASARQGNLQLARTDVPPLQPGEARTLDFTLPPGLVVAGHVRTPGGAPVADVKVHLRRLDLDLGEMGSFEMADSARETERTGDDGGFRFEAVTAGAWEVVLGGTAYRQARSGRLELTTGKDVTDLVLLAEEGLAVAGRVVRPDGSPVQGARVSGSVPQGFMSMRSNIDRAYRESVITDADGHFRLAGFDAGDVRLRVTASGSIAGREDVQAGDEQVVVTLEPLAQVAGIVVSLADGEPVTTFHVSIVPEGGLFDLTDMENMEERMGSLRPARAFRDRVDGTFTMEEVLPGDYDLTVTAKGYGATVVKGIEVPKEGRRGLVVLLPPESVITGIVVSGRDGRPVKDARITTGKRDIMSSMTEGLLGSGPECVTDAQGGFTLRGLGSDQGLSLTVRHPDFRELALPELVLAPGEQRDLGNVTLSVGAAVYGRVLDAEGGPVGDITVMVSNNTGTTFKRGTSDDEGRYRVEGLPPGSYNVMRMDLRMSLDSDDPTSFMKDMVMESVQLAEGEEKEVDLSAKSAGGTRVSGRVTAADGPVPGALMTLVPEHGGMSGLEFASTAEDGTYAFEGVTPGAYVLSVTVMETNNAAVAGQASSPVSQQLAVGGLPEQRQDVRLPGGELHGTVESAVDGTKLAGGRVILEREDSDRPDFGFSAAMDGRVGETYTDAQGKFRFRFLPSGRFAVVAGGQNVIGMGTAGWAQTRVSDLAVLDGGPGFSVRVEVRPAGGIAGSVRSPGGQPIAGAGVWVADAAGNWSSTFSEIVSDAAGAYSVGSLQEGTWTLAFGDVTHALKLVRDVLVREGGTTPLDVTLVPGIGLELLTGGHPAGSLQTALAGPDGAVPTGLVSLNEVMAVTGAEGTLKLGTFAPGTYHLTVMSGGEVLLDTTVTLSGSGTETVALEP